MSPQKRHFLVVAAASKGARYFIKNALLQGHHVTAICRESSNEAAFDRITHLLEQTKLSLVKGSDHHSNGNGQLNAYNRDILDSSTYSSLLEAHRTIDAIACFVGVTGLTDMLDKKHCLYTQTMSAIVNGLQASRYVEVYYHGSSGTEGLPGQGVAKLPDNYFAKPLLNLFNRMPAVIDYRNSESVLAAAGTNGLSFVIFRPAFLTSQPATGTYRYCFDQTAYDCKLLPIKLSKMTISREDVASEILRVATLPEDNRKNWYGHGVYLADMKTRTGNVLK